MTPISLTDFTEKINEILPQVIHEFSQRQANELYKGKLTIPQFLILDFLNRHQKATMSELARFLTVSTPAMTGIIERLAKCSYVARVSDDLDRRVIRVRLTPKGESVVKKIVAHRKAMIMDIFGKMGHTEREDYLRMLLHIPQLLTQEKRTVIGDGKY